MIAVVGLSGAGKTRLLRTLAGLDDPWGGQVLILGAEPQQHYGSGLIGFLHQEPCVWEHLTVQRNVELAYELNGQLPNDQEVYSLLSLVGLSEDHDRDRYPHRLSTGGRARLALARAFAGSPRILFADEPFASLDPFRRTEMNRYLKQLQIERHCTSLWATHDIVEAMRFADAILAFDGRGGGRVVYDDTLKTMAPIQDPCMLEAQHISFRDEILRILSRKPNDVP
jgi:ABC-type nitrate/sulfonate/bicarbonate transport system ATPase subunit